MLVTINQDRTIITVKSDQLSDFSAISSAQLRVKSNCELQETLDVEEIDIVNTDEFLVNASDLGITEFPQGVWGFELLVYDNDEVLTPEFYCLFVEVDLTCKVAAFRNSTAYTTDSKVLAVGDYTILQNAGECPSDCTDYCTIYENLIDVLAESDCA